MNTYGYVGGNPLKFIDVYGLRSCVDGLGNPARCPRNVCATAECAAGLRPTNQGEKLPTCEEKCDSFKSACDFGTAAISVSGMALEGSCTAAGIAAGVCMFAVNSTAGLATAYTLSACENAYQQCKKKCDEGTCK